LGWFIYALNNIMEKNRSKLKNIVYIIISVFFILRIKPYVLYALLPGSLIWLAYNRLVQIKSIFVKSIIIPLILIGSIFLSMNVISNLSSDLMREYSYDNVLKKAQVSQMDLTREVEYGTNYFDLGSFDATFVGIMSKFPIAVGSCLFRPFIWEVNGFAMLLSGLENTFMLFLFLFLAYKKGFIVLGKNIFNQPILLFSMCFVIIFAFGIGISTPNFGALVRYRLPAVPLFTVTLLILWKEINLRVVKE